VSILNDWAGAVVVLGSALGIIFGWLRWVRPRMRTAAREIAAVRDSILGREAVTDSITGAELSPALPGMGVRVAETERHLGVLAQAVATIAESHVRLEDHEARLVRLEEAAVERVVARAESTAAWAAMQAASESKPPEGLEGK
jgi:hypothetical protein